MLRDLGSAMLCAAIYGFAAGLVHSPRFACHNLLKFPLLILLTGVLCAVAYYLLARFVGLGLGFAAIQHLALRIFRDTSMMLAAFNPVVLFLALTIDKPHAAGLGEYPLFLGFNLLLIAICGSVALVRRTVGLIKEHAVPLRRGVAVMIGWLAISLMVGGQGAWYLRPFFGVSTIDGAQTRFCLGSAPDYRGATNFYEAAYHLAHPPPLPADYRFRGMGW